MHSPDHVEEAQRARSLGGIRRKREQVIRRSFDRGSLDSATELLRYLDVAMADTLAQDSSKARTSSIIAIVRAATPLLKNAEFESRLAALEMTLGNRLPKDH